MFNTLLKKTQILPTLAVICALILCIELTVMGFARYHQVLFGEANHHAFGTTTFSGARVIVNIMYISLNIIYVLWLVQNKKVQKSSSFLDILKYGSIFLILAFITYPFSNDIFMYLQFGLMGLNGVNPYMNTAGSFTSVLSPFIDWPSINSTYGPVSQIFFMLAANSVKVSPLLGVYVFKTFCLIIYVINAYVIWRFLENRQNGSKITMAYLINPLLLNQQVASAHTDVFLAHTLILFITFLARRYYIAGFLAIFAGFLAKTLPIIWLPLFSIFLVTKQRWKDLLIGVFLCLIIVMILSYTFFPTIESWKSLLNPGSSEMTSRSLHHIVRTSLQFFPNLDVQSQKNILSDFKLVAYLSFAVYYLWTLFQIYFRRSYFETNLILDIGWTTLILLLITTPWLMPWYPSILLAVAAVSINSHRFVITSITFCLSVTMIFGDGGGKSGLSLINAMISVGPSIAMLLIGRKFLDPIVQHIPLLNTSETPPRV